MEEKPQSIERSVNGYFLPGNKIGRGNPQAHRIGKYRRAIFRSTSQREVIEVFDALKKKAKEGDVAAAVVVLDRLLGKAVQPVEHTGDAVAQVNVLALLADPAMLAQANALAQALAHQADTPALPTDAIETTVASADDASHADITVPLCSDDRLDPQPKD